MNSNNICSVYHPSFVAQRKMQKEFQDKGYNDIFIPTHVQMLLPEIEGMIAEGKTQREVAEHFGLKDKEVVRELLKRERRKQRKQEAGILPRPKGRPGKDAAPRDLAAEQAYEIKRLKMENELLRDFLRSTGRR